MRIRDEVQKVFSASELTFPRRLASGLLTALAVVLHPAKAMAGPPYQSDDPEPTEHGHFEIYAYSKGARAAASMAGASGIDFNYGAAPDLQLTATLPIGFASEPSSTAQFGLGNIELAAKYRFMHQNTTGIDLSIFPRVFLPSPSSKVADGSASLLLPLWAQKDFGDWSVFGGGGCQLSAAGSAKNFCLYGGTVTRQITHKLQIGAELFHQTADRSGTPQSTTVGVGLKYDLNDSYHLLGYVAHGVGSGQEADQLSWYGAVLFTF
jgi:hypothetical protein